MKKIILNLSFLAIASYANFSITSLDLKHELLKKIDEGVPEWMTEQIAKDFSDVPESGITAQMIEQTLDQDPEFIAKFTIKDGQITIYTRPEMNRQDGCDILNNVLHELNSYIKLPDIEILYNVDDAPFNYPNLAANNVPPKSLAKYICPVLAPTKHVEDKNVIPIPDPHTLTQMKDILKEVSVGNAKYPWQNKQAKAFWRGATTGGFYFPENYKIFPRTMLVELSIKYPEILDAKFSNILDWWGGNTTRILNDLGYVDNSMPISEHLQYKYQILIDGQSAAWTRCFWQLHSNSVILKQNSNYIQWYHGLLKPYQHYIPFDYYCSNLIEQLQWAKDNEDKVQEIVKNANFIAETCLNYSDLLLYIYAVITHYSKLQAFKP